MVEKNDIWSIKSTCHLSVKIVFRNKSKSRKETDRRTVLHLEMAMDIKVVLSGCLYLWLQNEFVFVGHWMLSRQ